MVLGPMSPLYDRSFCPGHERLDLEYRIVSSVHNSPLPLVSGLGQMSGVQFPGTEDISDQREKEPSREGHTDRLDTGR